MLFVAAMAVEYQAVEWRWYVRPPLPFQLVRPTDLAHMYSAETDASPCLSGESKAGIIAK